MKTRIRVLRPDRDGDVRVVAEYKNNWFSSWTTISSTWAFHRSSYDFGQKERVDVCVLRMKRRIDDFLNIRAYTIKYPEDQ